MPCPSTLQDEMEAWAVQIDECRERLVDVLPACSVCPGRHRGRQRSQLPSGISGHGGEETERDHRPDCTSSPPFSRGLSSLDTVVEASGHLKTTAVVLMKIANDLAG